MPRPITCLALAALSLAAGCGEAVAADDALAPCRQLAAQARAAPINTDPLGVSARFERLKLAPANQTAPAALAQLASAKLAGSSVVEFHTAPGLAVWQAVSVQGTLHCQDDAFFRLDAQSAWRAVDGPPAFNELCWNVDRGLGSLDGRPVMIETNLVDQPYRGEDLIITPGSDAGWGAPCQLSLRYFDRFTVAEAFSAAAPVTSAARDLALQAVQAYVRGQAFTPPAANRPGKSDSFDRQAFDAALLQSIDLPTFGQTAKTPLANFGDAQPPVLVRLGGRPVVMRVGRGSLGWRLIGDYMVGFYDAATGAPTASLVISRQTLGLKSAEVSAPKPWVDPH